MNVTTLVKTAVWMALFAGISAAGIKYVAVVESDIDESSGASEQISRADVRLVTAELRREAVKNLPPKRYVIMTAETVMAQGGAVLEECADENCVITLGSRIGADYIVRGTVSKLESKFTLQVEMYETENGNLVASCDPVRAEGIGELVEKAAEACATMYKTWLASQAPEPEPKPATESGKPQTCFGANYTLVNSSLKTRSLFNGYVGIISKSSGLFFESDAGLGLDKDGQVVSGMISFNAGHIFHLPAGFALSLGGSVGFLFELISYEWDKPKDNGLTTIKYLDEYATYMLLVGPLITVRWKFIKVSYVGVMGYGVDDFNSGPAPGEWYSSDDAVENNVTPWHWWGWINQVKVGLYFEF
jgi:hypothetical protein